MIYTKWRGWDHMKLTDLDQSYVYLFIGFQVMVQVGLHGYIYKYLFNTASIRAQNPEGVCPNIKLTIQLYVYVYVCVCVCVCALMSLNVFQHH